jgi:predicted nucleic acid-binding Zn ribbon protein
METLKDDAYPCEQCDKAFGRKHHLKRQVLTHSRPVFHFTCDQCGTALTQKLYDWGHSGSKEIKCRLSKFLYSKARLISALLGF